MIEYAYRVADFPFVVRAPRAADLGALLPSFAPFRCRPGSAFARELAGGSGRFSRKTKKI